MLVECEYQDQGEKEPTQTKENKLDEKHGLVEKPFQCRHKAVHKVRIRERTATIIVDINDK